MAYTSTSALVNITSDNENKDFRFPIDAHSDCFCFYSLSAVPPTQLDKESGAYQVAIQLKDSLGKVYPEYQYQSLYGYPISMADFMASSSGYIAFPVPITQTGDSSPNVTGQWTGASLYDGSNKPALYCCSRTLQSLSNLAVTNMELKVKFVAYTSANGALLTQIRKYITAAINYVVKVYQSVPINIKNGVLQTKALPPGKISYDFNDPQTSAIVKENAEPFTLSVIFIEDLDTGTQTNAIGRSGGIPGPQGFTCQYSAVLVKLNKDPNSTFYLYPELLGNTIAHEMGHYLGLTHDSSEKQKRNLMSQRAGGNNTLINDTQKFILTHMPMVQVNYGQRELLAVTPVTDLEVAITTGTNTFANGSNQNDLMILNFGIGVNGSDCQTWSLSKTNEPFLQPGTTTTFQLQDIAADLYMEDLLTWGINCDWNNYMASPMNFLTVDNYWDFRHIKITANGQVIADSDINRMMSWIGEKNIQHTI